MNNQIKINALGRKIGGTCIRSGFSFTRGSVDFPKFPATKDEMVDYLETLGLTLTTSTYDRFYALTTFDCWKDVIAEDVVKTIQYVPEYFDCDNFAFAFASFAAALYGLTSALPCYGEMVGVGRHYFNIIVTKENGLFNAYLYEPITGKYAKIEKDKPMVVAGNTYIAQHIHLF